MKKRIALFLGVSFVLTALVTGYAVSSISGKTGSPSAAEQDASVVNDESTQTTMPASSVLDLPITLSNASTSAGVPDETLLLPTVPSEAPVTATPPTAARPITAIPATKPATTTTMPATKPATTKPPSIAKSAPSNIVLDNLLGKTEAYIIGQFGNPVAKEKSEYGFYWYVYHKNYSGLIMIGIQNNKVVGLYSNSAALKFENITAGAARNTVRTALKGYTGPLTSIVKGNTEYILPITQQKDVFTYDQKYVTIFYDNIKGGILTAVQIIDYATEQSFGLYPAPDKGFTDSYERISFYLINSTRVKFNKPVLQYDNNMAGIARAHSQDMIDRSYFSHITPKPDELNPGQRIIAAGYDYFSCAENIARNYPGAISAHENYMNSETHRPNILGDCKYLGVGVRMVQGNILQTELFITYP